MQLAPDRVGAETHAAQRGAPLTGLQFHLPPHLFQTTNKNENSPRGNNVCIYSISLLQHTTVSVKQRTHLHECLTEQLSQL